MAVVTLTFLGSFQAAIDNVPIIRFRSDKVRALLAYLAVEAERPHSRASLCGLLWPAQGDATALHNLSQTLLRLREALGDTRSAASFLRISRQAIQWSAAGDCSLDTADFTRLAASTDPDDLEQAAALYRGEFLPGFSLSGCAAFEEWLLLTRERFAHLALTALGTLTQTQLAGGRYAEAAQHARRQLALDLWREDAHRQLMRALAGAGNRAAALVAYERCRQVLLDDLGVEPDQATSALYEQIRTNELRIENVELKTALILEERFSILNSQFSISHPAEQPQPAVEEQPATREIRRPGDTQAQPRDVASASAPVARSPNRPWSKVPNVGPLYGRQAEAAQVEQWLLHDRCRLIAVLGMGGVGKTSLAATVAKAVAGHFEQIIWHSLLNAPPLDELLQPIVQAATRYTLTSMPTSLDEQLALLLDYLRSQRCLVVFDNLESILRADGTGQMRPGYEGYAYVLQQLASSKHTSCLILTSREQPQGLAHWEADLAGGRTLRLEGLDSAAGLAILKARGLAEHDADARALVARYSGHPLALKLVAQTVQELFGGAISEFLREETPIFDDIRAVLDQQFARLSALEQEILFWLAIEREPISAVALRNNLVQKETSRAFLEALRALQRCSLLERAGDGFTLQNVLLEYITDRLVEGVGAELLDEQITGWQSQKVGGKRHTTLPPAHPIAVSMLNRFALLKAQAKEYVRQSQARLILQPIADRLVAKLGKNTLAAHVRSILTLMRAALPLIPGYAAGNLLNLLLHLGADLRDADFSRLCVWQASLQGVLLPGVCFAGADLTGCSFSHPIQRIRDVQFDADGRLHIVIFANSRLHIWCVAAGQLCEERAFDINTSLIAFSPDRRLLISWHADRQGQVWDVSSGELRRTLGGPTDTPWHMVVSPDSRTLATGHVSGDVLIWDVAGGVLRRTLRGHTAAVPALAFSADGRLLASGDVDGSICLWQLDEHRLVRTLHGHSQEVHVLAFDPAGTGLLASGSHDRTVRLWEVPSGRALRTLEAHTDVIRVMAFSPDGRTLASGGGDTFICLWDVATGLVRQMLTALRQHYLFLAFDARGQTLATVGMDQQTVLWSTETGQQLEAIASYSDQINALDISPDGTQLISGGTSGVPRIWKVGAGRAGARALVAHTDRVQAVGWHPQGQVVASAGCDRTIYLWDADTRRVIRTLRGHTHDVQDLQFSQDGRRLVSCGRDATVRIWDVATGEPLQTFRGHTKAVLRCALRPDGGQAASGGMDTFIRLWEVGQHGSDVAHVLERHNAAILSIAYSPDGRLLLSSGYDQQLLVWSTHDGNLLYVFPDRVTITISIAFHPGGELLATADDDLVVRLWRIAPVMLRPGLLPIEEAPNVVQFRAELRGHSNGIEMVRFSPDGRRLYSASMDETIREWDVATGVCLQTLRAEGPYAGMNIAGVTGISEAQKAALRALGAAGEAPLAATVQIEASHPAPSPPHNLPSPLTSFVGRADELASLAMLLASDIRLITLVGAGGVGKTRLALAITWQLLSRFAGGVWWVELAGIQPTGDQALQRATLASAVARVLGRALGGRNDPLDELADMLQARAALLVLDNCEHLPEVPAVARSLLEAVPKVRVVATSREPLGLGGEALLRLEGLPVPLQGAADPAGYPSIQLFLDRAARHMPGWGPDRADGTVARLCRLLDGLPLAIELAAHWVEHYTPDEIASEIQADLDFLATRTRDVPDRHRSLRAVFEYAWRLLNAAEQQALMRLSIFRGSFDRAAAQAVADVRGTTLVALADKSLLQQAGVGRYNLHELLRQFAAERLGTSGDAVAMRARHAAYYVALAEQAAPELTRPDQASALERLDRALDNLRAALSWVWEQGQTELGLRLAGALERFWFTRGYLSEGREWLERFLAPAQALEAPAAVQAQAYAAAGLLANTQGDHIQATRWLELSLACYRTADDPAGAVRALTTLGGVAYDQGDLHEAIERWEQSLAQARAVDDLGEVARALGNLGEAHFHLGDLARAEALHIEALALARQLGRTNLEAFQLGDLGNVARQQGDLARATTLHKQALELKRALGARRQIAITLEDLASIAAAEGHATRAACLLGAATTIREAIGTPQATPERLATEQAVAGARAALGEEAWAAAFLAGMALPLDQAIAYALE